MAVTFKTTSEPAAGAIRLDRSPHLHERWWLLGIAGNEKPHDALLDGRK